MLDKKKITRHVTKQKYFFNTQNTKREFISRYDKYIREKLWLSNVDGTIKDRLKNLQSKCDGNE